MNLELARQLILQLSDALKPNVVVKPGDDLQAVINAAIGGDVIEVATGAYTTGALYFPAKSSPVTLRGQGGGVGRVTAMEPLPTISSGSPESVLNLQDSANWTFQNLAFGPRADGLGEIVTIENSDHITFNRVRMIGGANGQKRAIRANGRNITVTDSYIANIWRTGQDSQTICAWDGAGPYLIDNNFLEAAGENVMLGGSDGGTQASIPSDIRITNNLITKPIAWVGTGRSMKNLLELKVGKRVFIQGNTLDGNWSDAQAGWGIVIKVSNQDGANTWNETTDVTFENNILRNTDRGINIQGSAYEHPAGKVNGVYINNNTIETRSESFQIGGEAGFIQVTNNRVTNGWTFMLLYTGDAWPNTEVARRPALYAVNNLVIMGNTALSNGYGIKGSGYASGMPSLAALTVSHTWDGVPASN